MEANIISKNHDESMKDINEWLNGHARILNEVSYILKHRRSQNRQALESLRILRLSRSKFMCFIERLFRNRLIRESANNVYKMLSYRRGVQEKVRPKQKCQLLLSNLLRRNTVNYDTDRLLKTSSILKIA